MPTRQEAEEHLRVIRSLMERSTIYSAITAPVAFIGGLSTLIGCAFIALKSPSPLPYVDSESSDVFNPLFLPTWLIVLAITAIANTYFLWRDARRRGDVFLSPGLRAALRALIPSCLVASVLTFLLSSGFSFELPVGWMILYGLSLLATQHFAPRSIIVLGWAFLATGLCLLLVLYFMGDNFPPDSDPASIWRMSNLAMGATFGLFHLVYAAFTWPRKSTPTNPGGEP